MFVRNNQKWLFNKRKSMEKEGAIIFMQLFPLSSFSTAICELNLQEKLLDSSFRGAYSGEYLDHCVVSWNNSVSWIFMAISCVCIWIGHFCIVKWSHNILRLWNVISKIFPVLLLNCRYTELFVDLALLIQDELNISTRTRRLT